MSKQTNNIKHNSIVQTAIPGKKQNKIAVHLHLYYLEQLDEILQRLSYLNGCEYDLFVTMSKLNPQAQKKILKFNPLATIWQTPNLGYDIGPFIDFLHKISLNNYAYILKIHTKRVSDDYCLFNHKRFSIKTCRNMLLDGVLCSPQAVRNNLRIMTENPTVGMIGNDYILTDEKASLLPIPTLTAEMEKIGLQLPEDLHFVAGTMFFVRAKLLQPFLKYQITDFIVSEKKVHDNTLAHVLERLFGLAVTAQGYKIQGVKYKSYKLQIISDTLRRFFFQKKTTRQGKLIIKICKIPVYVKEIK